MGNTALLSLAGSFTLFAVSASALAAPPTTTKYAMVTPAGRIGTMTVVEAGSVVDVDWAVDDNGRGAKTKEHIELGKSGLPVRWAIQGKAWFGAPVDEKFSVDEQGAARWQSLNEQGESRTKDPLYLPIDGSPWVTTLLVKELMKSPSTPQLGHTRAILPAGTVALKKVKDVVVGKGKERLGVWAMTGIDLTPTFVLVRKDRLVSTLSPGWVICEEALAGSFAELAAIATTLNGEVLTELSKKLTHSTTVGGTERPMWIRNVRVFDSKSGALSAPTNVGVFRGRITSVRGDVAPEALDGAIVVDGRGGTLLPGLLDSHAHLDDWSSLMHIAAGVTLVRDPGNDDVVLQPILTHIDDGTLIGPRVKPSGFLEGKSPFSAHLGFIVDTPEDAQAKVRWYADHGYWGVKIYNSMNPAFVPAIAQEAHRLGLHVSGHVPAFMSSSQAIDAGYDEINHINQLVLGLMIDVAKEDTRTPFRFTALGERSKDLDLNGKPFRALVQKMKDKRVALDPTMATFSNLLLSAPGKTAPGDAGWLEHAPIAVQRARHTATLDIKPEQLAAYQASWKKLEGVLATLDKDGIVLVPGTDDTAGVSLHSELEAWARAGLPPARVLSLATLGGARFLGVSEDQGEIAAGKRADLYLVDGDPTKDIAAVRKGMLVVKGGSYYFPDELFAAVNITPFAAHAAVTSPK